MAKTQTPKQKVTFSYQDSTAREVWLVGDFTGWSDAPIPMKRDKKGGWKKTVSLPAGRYEYRLIVDGDWQDDPHCLERQPNQFGGENCVCIVGEQEAAVLREREPILA